MIRGLIGMTFTYAADINFFISGFSQVKDRFLIIQAVGVSVESFAVGRDYIVILWLVYPYS